MARYVRSCLFVLSRKKLLVNCDTFKMIGYITSDVHGNGLMGDLIAQISVDSFYVRTKIKEIKVALGLQNNSSCFIITLDRHILVLWERTNCIFFCSYHAWYISFKQKRREKRSKVYSQKEKNAQKPSKSHSCYKYKHCVFEKPWSSPRIEI